MSERVTCGGCRFFEAQDEGGVVGECHRRAPLPTVTRDVEAGDGATAWWPVVVELDWCGEWEQRDA